MNNVSTKRRRATFTVPADTLDRFARFVPERQRSRIVSDLMAAEAERREALLIAACEGANQDVGVRQVEVEFQAVATEIAEEWRG